MRPAQLSSGSRSAISGVAGYAGSSERRDNAVLVDFTDAVIWAIGEIDVARTIDSDPLWRINLRFDARPVVSRIPTYVGARYS